LQYILLMYSFQFEEAFVMKKITAILLVIMLMLAGLASCGSTGGDAQDAAAAITAARRISLKSIKPARSSVYMKHR